ncbi:helix-turn-helix domain-containing protein [Candidatus Rhodobacter oscarellae]|uniref:helix-turn-helix domain-containing protein n=1 Tax=Candidatus Rhodobacter oscarellae TaxID=1675527 RepID=UPI001364CF1C|nr:helix-turn-helix transcriptional regulator [Candidatus Rhodobacter lobularis]
MAENIRFLCEMTGTVKETAERVGIHRQQLSKYVKGVNAPSVISLKKICDHFCISETEIFLEPPEFQNTFRLKQEYNQAPIEILKAYSGISSASESEAARLNMMCGKFVSYKLFDQNDLTVSRSFLTVTNRNGLFSTVRYECNVSCNADEKYSYLQRVYGVLYLVSDRLYWIESKQPEKLAATLTFGTYYPTFYGKKLLWGKSVNVCPSALRRVNTSNNCLKKIGNGPITPSDLRQCGLLGPGDLALEQEIISTLSAKDF